MTEPGKITADSVRRSAEKLALKMAAEILEQRAAERMKRRSLPVRYLRSLVGATTDTAAAARVCRREAGLT